MTSSFGNDVPTIKVEGANGPSPAVKIEPDTAIAPSASPVDEDIYEDAGDLDFTEADQKVYLTRLPKILWETWSKLDEDQEIQVGTLRVEGAQGNVKRVRKFSLVFVISVSRYFRNNVSQMSMLLAPDFAKRKNVSQEYNLHITNPDSINTFVFSEKDLPGFKFQQKEWMLEESPLSRSNRVKKNKGRASNFRKTIPKQTALVGQVRTELSCLPVENAEYQRIMEERTRLAFQQPRRETQLVGGVIAGAGGNVLNPGALGTVPDLKSFINKSGPVKGKKTIVKTARMPQNELLDMIYDCFKDYTYWPLRSLKQQVNQPEAYLRQTLEMVAVMHRSGPHAMQWQLKPESRAGRYAEAGYFDKAKDEAAPELAPSGDLEDVEDDEEEVDMEDVPME